MVLLCHRFTAGPIELLLVQLALGDVLQKDDKLPAFGGPKLDADFDVERAAIFAAVPRLETILAQRHERLDVGSCLIGRFDGLQVGNAHG